MEISSNRRFASRCPTRTTRRLRRPPRPESVAVCLFLTMCMWSCCPRRVAAFLTSTSRLTVLEISTCSKPVFSVPFRPASSSSSSSSQLLAVSQRRSISGKAGAFSDSLFDTSTGYRHPTVQWYPGHIAKAERQLAETLKAVDVVVEVRDARACKATSHPRVGEWCAGRPRIVVLTHVDAIPRASLQQWKDSYEALGAGSWDAQVNLQIRHQALQAAMERQKFVPEELLLASSKIQSTKAPPAHVVSPVENVLFVNAKMGQGTHSITRAVLKAGAHVQERRERRGLKERALRVGVIGYPNVGKSALINRLLGRKRARTANTPGVTRSLQWIRVKAEESKTKRKEFELLDSPGIIPATLVDQNDAALLAACNCIGQAAYDNQAMAAFLCEWLKTLHLMGKGKVTAPAWPRKCRERYGFDPIEQISEPNNEFQSRGGNDNDVEHKRYRTGEDMLFHVADHVCRGNQEDAARKILQDFRAGRMGQICLQLAPTTQDDEGQQKVRLQEEVTQEDWMKQRAEELLQERQERAQAAVETAKKEGLELPPMVQQEKTSRTEESMNEEREVGKGLFDGW